MNLREGRPQIGPNNSFLPLRREVLAVFARGLAACCAGNLAEAERIFRQTAGVDPGAQAYADRCHELAAAPTKPTTDAWTGVWVMTSN